MEGENPLQKVSFLLTKVYTFSHTNVRMEKEDTVFWTKLDVVKHAFHYPSTRDTGRLGMNFNFYRPGSKPISSTLFFTLKSCNMTASNSAAIVARTLDSLDSCLQEFNFAFCGILGRGVRWGYVEAEFHCVTCLSRSSLCRPRWPWIQFYVLCLPRDSAFLFDLVLHILEIWKVGVVYKVLKMNGR